MRATTVVESMAELDQAVEARLAWLTAEKTDTAK